MKRSQSTVSLLLSAGVLTFAPAAFAQDTTADQASQSDDMGDIVVTARRRSETLISVPVVVSAVSEEDLANRGVVNLDGLSRIVPQLMIGPQGGAVQGGNISIRGISGPDSNPFGDQAVSFTIDGVQVAKASIRRMTDFDVSQVEVLKGPQALFYGKNSMAGIVVIQTNDPGDTFESGGKIGYEFRAREIRGEGYVSTPLTESLGFRLAGQYSTMDGYLIDQTPKDSIYYNDSRNPDASNYGIRATLKYDAGYTFDANLKFNYGKAKSNGPAGATEFVSCPLGARQFSFLPAAVADTGQCGAGRYNVNAGYGPVLATIPATIDLFRADGKNFSDQDQYLASLVMHWRPTDSLTITSATGLYKIVLDQCQNYEGSYAVLLPSCNVLRNREFSQDVNLATDFDGSLNFTAGLYYGSTKARTGSYTYLYGGLFDLLAEGFGGPDSPALVNNYMFSMTGKAYSAFMQGLWKITPELELSGGIRYSYEKKRLTDVRDGGGITEPGGPYTTILDDSTIITTTPNALGASLLKDHDSWKDWSPEATLTYRPTGDMTIFASYKQGFLSGSFNSSSVNLFAANVDLSYKPQRIEGFELGLKTRVGDVLFNIAGYHYTIDDLQVVNFTNATSSIRNAAKSKVKGIEADFTWRTPLDGLTVNGAAAYNKARYDSFPGAPCYNGQTIAEGCVGGVQELGGQVVPRSPKWNIQGGFNYETPVGDSFKLGLNGGFTHSSSYLTDASNAPNSRQDSYTLYDATIRFGAYDDSWQLALIGRNLSDKYIFFAAPDVPFTGSGTGTETGVLGDRFATVSRGREILLQVSFKFGS